MKQTGKDNTAVLLSRYSWLIDLLIRKKRITYEKINEAWQNAQINEDGIEFPLRTFHNHRKAIESLFEIIIKCNRSTNEYFIEDVEEIKKDKYKNWLLNHITMNNLIKATPELQERILLEEIPAGQIYLTPIINALRNNEVIKINYHSFNRDESYTVEVQPYCLKIFKQRWYLVGLNCYQDKIFIYALDRIKDIEETTTKFSLPESFDGEEFFSDCFGIIVNDGTPTEEVKIKVYGHQVNYVETLPLHHSQKKTIETEDYSIFTYNIKPTFDFKQALLSYGEGIEVLKPESLRAEMEDHIKKMIERYVLKNKP